MRVKAEIEIVTGLLGTGKTSFINELLNRTLVAGEKVLVIQCEEGEKALQEKFKSKSKVIAKQFNPSKTLTSAYLKQMIDFYNPHRIIIEQNGMKLLDETLNVVNALEEYCLEPVVYNITDALTFEVFFNNMKDLIAPFIVHSNLIVLNNCSSLTKENKSSLLKQIEALNSSAFVIPLRDITQLNSSLRKQGVFSRGIVKTFSIKIKNNVVRWSKK